MKDRVILMYENFQKSIDRLSITAYKVSVETGISLLIGKK